MKRLSVEKQAFLFFFMCSFLIIGVTGQMFFWSRLTDTTAVNDILYGLWCGGTMLLTLIGAIGVYRFVKRLSPFGRTPQ